MKLRKEKSGLHLFNRVSGLHILFDEIKIPEKECMCSPRTLSIALTNKCNMNCNFCYAEKGSEDIDINFLKNFCKKIDELGVLEITLGGGEPFIYPNLVEFCNWIWENTSLGINITTNASLITPEIINSIKNTVSSIRISMEAIYEEYDKIRNAKFKNINNIIKLLKENFNTAINCTVLKGKVYNLENVIKYAIENKVHDVLIIAQHKNGQNILSQEELNIIENIILKYKDQIQLNVTENLGKLLNIDILNDENNDEYSFLHLSVDKKIKLNSFSKKGILIDNIENLKQVFSNQYEEIKRSKI